MPRFGSDQYDSPPYLREFRKVAFEHRRGHPWNAVETALNLTVRCAFIRFCRFAGRPVK